MLKKYRLYSVLALLVLSSCKKDKGELIPNNTIPYYKGIQRVVVENYVNRLFIDLIGREPLDAEMKAEVDLLQTLELSITAREQLIRKLQTNMSYISGDSSYMNAYYNRFYELCKARALEGASNAYIDGEIGMLEFQIIKDSLAGDLTKMALHKREVQKLKNVKACEIEYRQKLISINEVFARMLSNGVYDIINMNTFNFVNASFDDLFFRAPTTSEFDNAYDMVENDTPRILFGASGQSKDDYVNILTSSKEFYEGLIRWAYKTLLARDPSTQEVYTWMLTFYKDGNFQKIQEVILKTDEYANFK